MIDVVTFRAAMKQLTQQDATTGCPGLQLGFLRDAVSGFVREDVMIDLYAFSVNFFADEEDLLKFVSYVFLERQAGRIKIYFPDRKVFTSLAQRYRALSKNPALPVEGEKERPVMEEAVADVSKRKVVLRWWKTLLPGERDAVYNAIVEERRRAGDAFTIAWFENHRTDWNELEKSVMTRTWVMDYYERHVEQSKAA